MKYNHERNNWSKIGRVYVMYPITISIKIEEETIEEKGSTLPIWSTNKEKFRRIFLDA